MNNEVIMDSLNVTYDYNQNKVQWILDHYYSFLKLYQIPGEILKLSECCFFPFDNVSKIWNIWWTFLSRYKWL